MSRRLEKQKSRGIFYPQGVLYSRKAVLLSVKSTCYDGLLFDSSLLVQYGVRATHLCPYCTWLYSSLAQDGDSESRGTEKPLGPGHCDLTQTWVYPKMDVRFLSTYPPTYPGRYSR